MGLLDAPANFVRSNIGVRLHAAAVRGLAESGFNRPTLADVASWAQSTAYGLGQVVKNGGLTYICIQAGTSASTGTGPTGTFGSIAADGTALWDPWGWNPYAGVDGRAPVYSSSQASVGLNNTFYAAFDSKCFALYGAYSTVFSTNYWRLNKFNKSSSVIAQGDASVAFWTDAPKVAILSGLGDQLHVRIDGQIYSIDQLKQYTTGGGTVWHVFDFTTTSGRKPRLFQVDINKNTLTFYGVQVDARSSVWKPSQTNVIRAAWISDSTMEGIPNRGPHCWSVPQMAGSLLGWADNWNASTGGTGYINTNTTTGPFYNFRQRIPELLTRNPDIWMLFGSINDNIGTSGSPYTASAVTAQVLGTLQDIRNGGSKAPIVVGGCWNTYDDTGILATENAVAAAVTQFADPLTFFVPLRNDPAGPWVSTPSNNPGHTATDQHQQILGPDNTHPTEAGAHYYARRIDAAVREQVLPQILAATSAR